MSEFTCTRCQKPKNCIPRRGMCPACYMAWNTRQHAYGRFESVFVDAEPARQHVHALVAAGVGVRRIAVLTGIPRTVLTALLKGLPHRGSVPSRRVSAKNADAILAVEIPTAAHKVVSGGSRVDATGTIRRLQALVAHGYTRTYLAERLGIRITNATALFKRSTTSVNAATALSVEQLFRELELQPGPSDRARQEGKRRRWPLPLDWDEDRIDDPTARVHRAAEHGSRLEEAAEERREKVAELTRVGLSAREIAVRLDLATRTVQRDRAYLATTEVAS